MAAKKVFSSLASFTRLGCSCLQTMHSQGMKAASIQSNNIRQMSSFMKNNLSYRPVHLLSVISRRHLASKSKSKKKSVGSSSESLKVDLKLGADVMYHELPIVFINATYNNTMFTITDHNGRTAGWTSAGAEGFKGAKRGTNYAGQMAGVAASKKAISFGVNRVRVKIRGMGPGRQTAVKGLMAGGVEIISVTDVTPIPHNGCRPPKQRRI